MEEVENSLIQSIAQPGMELTPDLLELGIEELAHNEAVDKIPVVGSLVALGKGVVAVRDWMFVKDILAFLQNLSDVDQKKKENWIRAISGDKKHQQRVGEELLALINKMGNKRKSSIAGRLFGYFLEEKISYEDFLRISEKLERTYLGDLDTIAHEGPSDDNEKERFRALGLYRIHFPGIAEEKQHMIAFFSNSELIPNDDYAILANAIRDLS